MPPYTNAEAGLRPLGRAPRPSPCTRCVWVPRPVPRAFPSCAGRRHRLAPLARRPPCVAAHPAVPRPCHACTASPLALVSKEALNCLELGYKSRPVFSLARDRPEPPRPAIEGARRAPRSGLLQRPHVLLLTPLGPPVAPALACWPARAAGSPEPVSPRPPPGSHRRALLFARPPSQPTHRAPSLGYLEALCAAHCSAESFPSPDFAQPRPCCPCSAAAARRRPLRPSCHRQSPRGESNRLPRRLFATPCSTSLPASSPSPPGSREGNQGYGCEDSKNSRDPSAKRFLSFCVFQLKFVKCL
jgi:hypothetical protein